MPEWYGPWSLVFSLFVKWRDSDLENISIDSTSVSPPGYQRRKKTETKAVGRSRGGLNTKIHTLVDALSNPLRFLLSAGQENDPLHAVDLLDQVDISSSNILGDKAYGTKTF